MPDRPLKELRIDEGTWSRGSLERRREWRLCLDEVVEEGRFQLPTDGEHHGILSVGPDQLRLDVFGPEGSAPTALDLPLAPLRPLMAEYMGICTEMVQLREGARSPRLEALDIAKRLTHDEAGELVCTLLARLGPDHGTARRIFTLLVTLCHDTTRLGARPHVYHA